MMSGDKHKGLRRVLRVIFLIWILSLAILSIIAGIFLIVSGRSMMFLFTNGIRSFYSWLTDVSVFAIEVPKSIISALGIGSLILPWIYAKWDEKSFGLPYKEYIRRFFLWYPSVTVTQLVMTLLCIAASNIGARECAWLSLMSVLFSMILQVIVLLKVILASQYREDMAPALWKNKITDKDASGSKMQGTWVILFQLAKLFSSSESNTDISVYSSCIIACLDELAEDFHADETTVENLVLFWQTLCSGDLVYPSETVYQEIMEKAEKQISSKPEGVLLDCLSAAYLAYYILNSDNDDSPIKSVGYTKELMRHIYLRREYLQTCFSVITWALFLKGQLDLDNVYLLDSTGSAESFAKESQKNTIYLTLKYILLNLRIDTNDINDIFQIIVKQMIPCTV